ncbi:MAG TPA: hypothetical protein VN611_18375 [Patescibacteria group bacterium]|nr:hypothetical protein [Patescibacteria group bacterium]
MKEYMYTYHYYRNRAVVRPQKAADYILSSTLIFGAGYLGFLLLRLF